MNKRLLAILACVVIIAVICIIYAVYRPTGVVAIGGEKAKISPRSSFIAGVNNWLVLKCVAERYGPKDAFKLEYEMYETFWRNGGGLKAPIAQLENALSTYKTCSFTVTQDVDYLITVINDSLRLIDELAKIANISKNDLGTPTFIVYPRNDEYAYVVIGADPTVLEIARGVKNASSSKDNVRVFKCDHACKSFLKRLESEGIVIGRNGSLLVEFIDTECPACAYFHLKYGDELERLIDEGVVKYIVVYFPTHVLAYAFADREIGMKVYKAIAWYLTN